MLKWAVSSAGFPFQWNAGVCAAAAAGGHLDVLQWARTVADPPCAWDSHTCRLAADNGHFKVLRWARREADPPCPWDAGTEARARQRFPEKGAELGFTPKPPKGKKKGGRFGFFRGGAGAGGLLDRFNAGGAN